MNVLGDQLAALQTRYAFLDISEVTAGLTYAMPVMDQTKMKVKEVNAALAMMSMGGLHGEMAGTAFRKMIAKLTTKDTLQQFVRKTKQGGLDLAATMEALYASVGKDSPLDQTRELKSLGFNLRDVQGVSILMGRIKELRSVEADLDNSRGEAARLAGVRMSAADEQWATLMNNVDLLRESLGENLLPAINRLIPRATEMLRSMTEWAHAHNSIVQLGLEIAAVGAAILIPLGSLAVFLASLGFIASYIPLILKLGNVFKLLKISEAAASLAHFGLPTGGWGSLVTAVRAASVAFMGYATALWSGVSASVAFLATNPIGWAILAVAGLAALIYAIYRYRDSIGAWLSFVGTEFSKLGNLAFDWGVNLLKKFGEGIASGTMWAVHAIEGVAGKMARFVVGHSPIPEGALHDLNLGRDLARTIQPAPVVSAIRRFATTVALAAPMMVATGAPALAAPMMVAVQAPAIAAMAPMQIAMPAIAVARMAAPEMVRVNAPALALAAPDRSEIPGKERKLSGANITIDFRPNVTVHVFGHKDDPNVTKHAVLQAIRDGGGELLRLVEEAMRKRSRTEF